MPIQRFLNLAAVMLAMVTVATASAQQYPRPTASVLVRDNGIYLRCDQCGTVEAIEHNMAAGSGHSTAGTLIGSIAGSVLGNQIGRGNGRTLATVAGAVGGGVVGNQVGQGSSSNWTLRIRMSGGSYTNVTVSDVSAIRQGDLVQIAPNGNVVRIQ